MKNRDQIFNSGEASGASGSFFFFSYDKRFIIKSMTEEELTLIQKILPSIYQHLKKYPNSLLARIYGVYRVQMKNYAPVNLIMMGNTLKFKRKDDIFRVYDLKGSRVARLVKGHNLKPTSTLKDLNFFENMHLGQEVNLSKEDTKMLREQLYLDTQMLCELNIMDYSLLLGIEKHDLNRPITPYAIQRLNHKSAGTIHIGGRTQFDEAT